MCWYACVRSSENDEKILASLLRVSTVFTTPLQLQKLLFSATLSQNPEKLHDLRLFDPKLFTSVGKKPPAVARQPISQSEDSKQAATRPVTPKRSDDHKDSASNAAEVAQGAYDFPASSDKAPVAPAILQWWMCKVRRLCATGAGAWLLVVVDFSSVRFAIVFLRHVQFLLQSGRQRRRRQPLSRETLSGSSQRPRA